MAELRLSCPRRRGLEVGQVIERDVINLAVIGVLDRDCVFARFREQEGLVLSRVFLVYVVRAGVSGASCIQVSWSFQIIRSGIVVFWLLQGTLLLFVSIADQTSRRTKAPS